MALVITYKELEDITHGDDLNGTIKIISNKIPYDSTDPDDSIDDYIEDDGRQYRLCKFIDLRTNEEYFLNYVWNNTYGYDFPCDLMAMSKDIEIVSTSVINPPVEKAAPSEPLKTAEQLADDKLMAEYRELNDSRALKIYEKGMVPHEIILDIKNFLKTQKFSIYQLRAKIIPICIEYKLEQKSFWRSVN